MNRQPVRGDVIRISGAEQICIDSERTAVSEGHFMAAFATIKRDDLGKQNPVETTYYVSGYCEVVDAKSVRLNDITFLEQVKLKEKAGAYIKAR